jgi:hypothetical protein
MKNVIGVLILFVAGGLFTGCWIVDAGVGGNRVNEARIGTEGFCDSLQGPAVSLSVVHANNGMPINNFKIRYRINNGGWTDSEHNKQTPLIIPGPPGKYDLGVRAQTYSLQTAVVFVPQDEGCAIIQQDVEIPLQKPSVCPESPQVIILDVVEPSNITGLSIDVNDPSGEPFSRQCEQGRCIFNLQTDLMGNYTVTFKGFPDQRKMYIENSIVRYSYMNVAIYMIVGERKHQIVTEGVDNVGLTIPFNYGDSGCPEVIFNQVNATRTHFQNAASNMLVTKETQNLQIADLSSESCQRSMVNTEIEYDVRLPAGTNLNNVKVEYLRQNEWVKADCRYSDVEEGYICIAEYPNPLFGNNYNIRATIDNDREYFGSNISLENKCIIFE